MCVFLFGVGTEAGKGGGEWSACSSPFPFQLKDQSVEEIQMGNKRKKKISVVGALYFSYCWRSQASNHRAITIP